jgi:fluoride exporter
MAHPEGSATIGVHPGSTRIFRRKIAPSHPAIDNRAPPPQGNPMIQTISLVALGGAIGSVLRYLTVLAVSAPLGTFIVNVAGSFLIGMLYILIGSRAPLAPLLMTGILGGFTTFSAFSLDTLSLWEKGQPLTALTYVMATVLLSLAAVMAGAFFARGIAA